MRYPKILRSLTKTDWLVVAYLCLYLVMVSLLVLHRWWQFEVYYFDHGIFDQSLWSAAHGRWPMIDHLEAKPLNQLGDHFTPSLYLLAPLYWLTTSYEPLLVLQVLCVVISAGVMYALSRRWLGPRPITLALLFAYTWFVGLQNALIAGFHTELPALATLALCLYAAETKRWRWYWVLFVITLGFKEVFVTIGAGIGVYLLLTQRAKQGLLSILYSAVYYYLATRLIVPVFSGRPYDYKTVWPSVIESIKLLVIPEIKLRTIFLSLVTFGFLPLLALPVLPLLLQDLLVRFVLSPPGQAMSLTLHYSAMLSLLLYFASAKAVSYLERWSLPRRFSPWFAVCLCFLVLILHHKLQGPFGLTYNRSFYEHTPRMQFLADFVRQIPNDGLVMTQNNLAVRLTHTHQVMLLREDYQLFQPTVIALDIRAGQSPNNYWPADVTRVHQRLLADPNYQFQVINPEQVLFIRRTK